ncbi:putative membrane protein [Peribacillus deserti]|uniref:Membrane protein n=1 Tax=Peribacillus deserti TaxID=673318 RepID=A0ABS2QN43_9BACI|nr:PH domain-containing protein [Peribacillus deserti]MBM7694584.1 putative membrane protein [Peribacillus deserti]
MFKSKRLHPAAAITNTLNTLKGIILPYLIVFVFGGSRPEGIMSQLLFGSGFILLSFIIGVLRWRSFTYTLDHGEFLIEQGILIRKKRYIRINKIQSLDITQGIIQRLFNLVSLKVETAGGNKSNEPEVILEAISREEAEAITSIISKEKEEIIEQRLEESQNYPVYTLAFRQLFIFAGSSGRVGIVFSGAAAVLLQFQEVIPYNRVFRGIESFAASGLVNILLLLAAALILSYAAATIHIVFKFAHSTVQKKKDDLILTSGLFEKRQLTIPFKKIQAVKMSQNIIRQPFGYITVYLYYAGGAAAGKGNSRVMLFPLIKKNELRKLLREFLPGYSFEEPNNGLPTRAFIRYAARQLYVSVPLSAVMIWLLFPWGLASLLLIIISIFWAYQSFRDAAWRITDECLSLRFRMISRHTYIIQKTKIQALRIDSGFLQRRKKLNSIIATVISGTGPARAVITDLDTDDAEKIKQWFAPDKEQEMIKK